MHGLQCANAAALANDTFSLGLTVMTQLDVQTLAMVVQSVASVLGLLALLFLALQLRQTRIWNRLDTQHQLVSSCLPGASQELDVWKLLDGKERVDGNLTQKAAKALYANVESWAPIKVCLSQFERFCAAVNAKAVDEDYAYSVCSHRVTDAYYIFQHFVSAARSVHKDSALYIDLQHVATRWRERDAARDLAFATKPNG